jgi:CubicO group peptidase (beta-lactamase class C family)
MKQKITIAKIYILPLILSIGCSVYFSNCKQNLMSKGLSKTSHIPKQNWMKYANPQDAGFSLEKLQEAKQYWDSTQSAACMIVHRGAVVAAWGEIERRFMCHSVRKSLLSSLYGISVDAGVIDIHKTLKEIGIDDRIPLTEMEKQARIVDLLKSASGIYLPAASEDSDVRKPKRESHKPGTYMFYNNWDFNALSTIFEKETKTNLFREFNNKIAEPIQMQDFRERDGCYSYQLERSIHPAYIFRMSTRDLARFGLLYLNKGKWDDSRILSENWVKRSTSIQINANQRMGYGFLWWVYKEKPYSKMGFYEALGVGEQALEIVPSEDLVVVLRTNTFARKIVSRNERLNLMKLILEAKCEKPSKKPELVNLPENKIKIDTISIAKSDKDFLCIEPLTKTENSIYEEKNEIILKTPYGHFGILKTKDGKWIIEDKYQEIIIERTADETLKRIITEWSLSNEGRRYLDDGKLDEAIKIFKQTTDYYPNSIIGYSHLGEAYLKSNMKNEAIKSYEKAHQVDPENREVSVELRKLKFVMPDGLAAQWAEDYFNAFNSADSIEYVKYHKEYYPYVETPFEERISRYRESLEEHEGFEPLLAVKKSNLEIFIFARDLKNGMGWINQFKLEEESIKGKKSLAIGGPYQVYYNEEQILEILNTTW